MLNLIILNRNKRLRQKNLFKKELILGEGVSLKGYFGTICTGVQDTIKKIGNLKNAMKISMEELWLKILNGNL